MTSTSSHVLRLGTRGSLLARTQSGMVAEELRRRHPGLAVELVIIKTTGDRIQNKPLHDAGGKGLFTKELEQALLANEVDFAVHSFKDVPVTMPLVDQTDLIIASVPPREDPRDCLAANKATRLTELAKGARVGTGSLRRRCQVLALRGDLDVQGIRGNIDTRLRKLREGEFDAVVLAMAGVKRAGLFDAATMAAIDAEHLIPAAGQGALAIQCRKSDARTRELIGVLNDPATQVCVDVERAVVMALQGDCHSPIAAYARCEGTQIRLETAVGGRDGAPPVIRAGAVGAAGEVVGVVHRELLDQGVEKLLDSDLCG